MPGNDVTGSHSSVRTTTKQCSGSPRQLLSKCQRQPRPKSLKGSKLEGFVLYLSRPHFPQALPGTWQQLHLPLPPPYFASPPPARQGAEKKALPPGSPALECRLVAKLRISPKYPETRGSARAARVTFFYDCELKSKNCCSRVVSRCC
ncbi:uncharacterized protein LOC101682339 isoform X3 [Mustela putorius furo]|uniref:Uncharacterized protein LOC101682339 isoform X3 n=1 Tax=Mustela putorius furo TaxID=9669 RepID=A0A8U0TBL5_MUSPF|nr:uncharacterized protein LOC101682339 isoform X3 [Mustela putorius furo]